ncbi:MAG: hypothetical protein HKN14_09545 [Marinicaulis sp.]|nr:hypothetical protein [Marinicaulis sp.]NNL89954.1 hypothetical protein [Marinicaulis sp.]
MAAFSFGNVLAEHGRYKDANVYLCHAVARDPAMAEAHYNLDVASEACCDVDSARQHFASALKSSAEFPGAFYSHALSEFSQDNVDKAAHLFRKFLQIKPTGEWADRARKALSVCGSIAKSA